MKTIDLDQLLDQDTPLCAIKFDGTVYDVHDPDNMPEKSRLRFFKVKAQMADLYENAQGTDTIRPRLRDLIMMDHDQLPLMKRWVEALCQMPDKVLDKHKGSAVKQVYRQLTDVLPKEIVEGEEDPAEKNGHEPKKEELPQSSLTTTSVES